MDLVVKATGQTGNVTWLAFPDGRGFRTFGTRQMAEPFKTVEEAQNAIIEIQRTLMATGLNFSIEPADY
jgi:hypothetical protein